MLSLAARSASAVWNSRQQRPNRTQKRALVQLEPARPAMAAHAFLGDSDQPGTRWSMGLPYAEATGSGGGGRGSSNSGEGGGEGGGTPLPQPAPVSRPKSARALSSMGIADLVAVGAALAVPITWAVRQEALLTALDVKLDTKLDALDTKLDALDNKLDALGNQMSTMDNNLNTKIAALDAKLTKVDLLLCVLASFATLKLGQRLALL